MADKILTLGCHLIVPLMMMFGGWLFRKHPSRQINGLYGYRTALTMKNQETWDAGQQIAGRIWWKTGCVMAVVAALLSLCLFEASEAVLSVAVLVICFSECMVMLLTLIPMNRAMRRRFPQDKE